MKDKYKKFLAVSAMSAAAFLSNSLHAQENQVIADLTIPEVMQIHDKAIESNKNENINVPFFETLKTSIKSKKAYIFVSGANGTFHVWDKHLEKLKNEDVTIIGYEGVGGKGSHPQNVEYMEKNAELIADGIKELKKQGIEEVNVMAHCLGGVVSKRAMHMLDDDKALDGFNKVNFLAISSPLGGYVGAIGAQFTPFFRPISKYLNIAMSTDMSPISDFYESISKPFSDKINATLIETPDDTLVQPETSLTRDRYETVANTFKNRVVTNSNNEHMFALEPKTLEDKGINLLNLERETIFEKMQSIRNNSTEKNTNAMKVSLK